jgi:hypothetical protein
MQKRVSGLLVLAVAGVMASDRLRQRNHQRDWLTRSMVAGMVCAE